MTRRIAIGLAAAAGVATGASAQMAFYQPQVTSLYRAGTATSDSTGNIAVTYSAPFSAVPSLDISPETKGVTCDVIKTTNGFTGKCYTAVYNTLGGAPTYTAAGSIPVDWQAVLAN